MAKVQLDLTTGTWLLTEQPAWLQTAPYQLRQQAFNAQLQVLPQAMTLGGTDVPAGSLLLFVGYYYYTYGSVVAIDPRYHRPAEVETLLGDASRARAILGWTPRTGFEGEPNAAVVEVASVLFNDLIERKGLSVEDARKSMARTEPFQKYPALVAKLGSKK